MQLEEAKNLLNLIESGNGLDVKKYLRDIINEIESKNKMVQKEKKTDNT